jgi:PhnB protein
MSVPQPERETFRTTLAANLIVTDGIQAIEFYTAAFGAVELYRVDDAGVVQLSIGGAEFWIAEEGPELGRLIPTRLAGRSVSMILSVEDPGALWTRAVAAGAVAESPVEESHGWLIGSVVDPFGHRWEIARPPDSWPPG